MADGAPYTKQQNRLASSTPAPNKKNPSKFYSSFLFKALMITLFLVIIPLFPSDSPDFHASRGWELLQLILVGIAVSYGIFSRKNDNHTERENHNAKNEGAHSYMARLLQFPSIFDDEVDEQPSGSNDNNNNSNTSSSGSGSGSSSDDKLQTWSSRYRRNEPLLVVAKKSAGNDGIEKPLLLPVRSLKSKISDGNDVDLDGGGSRVYARSHSMPSGKELSKGVKRINSIDGGFVSGENSRVHARSNWSPGKKGLSNDSRGMSRNYEFGFANQESEDFGVSLSRSNSIKGSSGRFGDFDDKDVGKNATLGSEFVSYANEHDNNNEVSILPLSRSNSSLSSKGSSNKLGSSSKYVDFDGEDMTKNATLGSEFGSYANGDNNRVSGSLCRSNSSSSPRGSSKKNSSKLGSNGRYGDSDDEENVQKEEKHEQSIVLPSPIPWRSRSGRIESKRESPRSSMEGIGPTRSFKPPRSPSISSATKEPPIKTSPLEPQAKSVEDIGRRKVVLGFPPPPPPPPPPPSRSTPRPSPGLAKSSSSTDQKAISNGAPIPNGKSEAIEESGRKSGGGYDPMSKEFFSGFPKETRDFLEDVFVETDYDSESDDNDNYREPPKDLRVENEKVEEQQQEVECNENIDEGPDVDKKADEFIAKFREQIRLQRIEEIKRAAGQLKRSSLT